MKVQGENQLGYHLVDQVLVLAFKTKPMLAQQREEP